MITQEVKICGKPVYITVSVQCVLDGVEMTGTQSEMESVICDKIYLVKPAGDTAPEQLFSFLDQFKATL